MIALATKRRSSDAVDANGDASGYKRVRKEIFKPVSTDYGHDDTDNVLYCTALPYHIRLCNVRCTFYSVHCTVTYTQLRTEYILCTVRVLKSVQHVLLLSTQTRTFRTASS